MSKFLALAGSVFEAQLGVASRQQLVVLGLTEDQIDHARRRGLVLPVHRGVFRLVGCAPTTEQRAMAASLTVPGALVAGWSAGQLLGFRSMPRNAGVELLTHHANTPTVPGIRVRRSRRLRETDRHEVGPIAVTSGPRTIADLSRRLGADRLESVIHQAVQTGVCSLVDLWDVTDWLWPRPGLAAMRRVLGVMSVEQRAAESALELDLFRTLRAAAFPVLSLQHPVELPGFGRIRFDGAYVPWLVGVEADHPFWHGSPSAIERDRRRDEAAAREGWLTLRFTNDEIHFQPDLVMARVLAALTERGYVHPYPVR